MLTRAKLIEVEQGTPEWLESRLGRATASDFAKIMGNKNLAAYKNYRTALVTERLTQQSPDFFKSPAMEWGTETEPLARLKYELRTGNEVDECGFFLLEDLEAGASPDGLIGDDGLLEIKCPNTATHLETLRKGAIPKQYYWQVMGQLWITGRQWCDFVSFDPRLPDNASYFSVRIERDDTAIQELEEAVKSFLESVDSEIAFIKNYKEGA